MPHRCCCQIKTSHRLQSVFFLAGKASPPCPEEAEALPDAPQVLLSDKDFSPCCFFFPLPGACRLKCQTLLRDKLIFVAKSERSATQFSNPFFVLNIHIGEAENAKKADKLNAKRQRMEEPCGDGNGPLKKPAAKAKKAAPKAGAKDKVETPKAKAKGLPKAIASPKKRSRKPKAADSVPVASPKVKATKRNYRRMPVQEASVESEAGQSAVELTSKEKRRIYAQQGWKRLEMDQLPFATSSKSW